MEIKLR